MENPLEYLEGRLLASKQLHEVQAWQKQNGITQAHIGDFVQLVETFVPAIVQNEALLLADDATKAQALLDRLLAGGLPALGVKPK